MPIIADVRFLFRSWIPGTVFQFSTAHYKNGTATQSSSYKPFIHFEVEDTKKAHIPVLKLFANNNPIYLKDFTFDIVDDGSLIVSLWHQ
jgi:hypothetical protein